MRKFRYPLFVFFLFFLIPHSKAQGPASIDSSVRQHSIDQLIALYQKTQGPVSNLYNGQEPEAYPSSFYQSTPFFNDLFFTRGAVHYDNVSYPDVKLLYDLVRDQLMVLHMDGLHQINLVKEKVAWFELDGHRFVNLRPSASGSVIKPGYYDELYKGKVSLFMKRLKTSEPKIENSTVYLKAYPKSSFYLLKDGNYLLVKNKKELLRLLQDKRAALNQYIRRNRIKFRTMPETAMTSVVSFYDQLKK